MSFLVIYVLLWIGFTEIQDCAVIHLDHSKNVKGYDYVVQKYLNPLRRLTAELPNHAIEMQIEIHDAIPDYTKRSPQRRVIRVVKPHYPKKPVKRSEDETQTTSPEPVPQPQTPASNDPGKQPVFMDDLKKALDDLEKKLSGGATTVDTGPTTVGTAAGTNGGGGPCNGGGAGNGGGGGGAVNNMLQTPIRSIDNIVEILKKAIHIEHREPKPSENLEWVQVKIPKTRK